MGWSNGYGLLKNAFLNSSFEFKADKNFTYNSEFEEMQIKIGHWKFNKVTNSIVIQEWKDRHTNKSILMEITIKKDSERVLFLLSESSVILEMKKHQLSKSDLKANRIPLIFGL